jgi:hypothetical protein
MGWQNNEIWREELRDGVKLKVETEIGTVSTKIEIIHSSGVL